VECSEKLFARRADKSEQLSGAFNYVMEEELSRPMIDTAQKGAAHSAQVERAAVSSLVEAVDRKIQKNFAEQTHRNLCLLHLVATFCCVCFYMELAHFIPGAH